MNTKINGKPYKIIGDRTKMSYQEWLDLRKSSIGGSEIASAVGLSRWQSPFALWIKKTGRMEDKPLQSESMYWGHALEGIIRDEFAKRNKIQVQTTSLIFQSIKYPHLTANIDGYYLGDDGKYHVLEIKTANMYSTDDWSDGLPIEYYCQVMLYMYITGMTTYATVAVLLGGNKYKEINVEYDEDMISFIILRSSEFWSEFIIKDIPPKANAQDNELLAELYPKSNSLTAILPNNTVELLVQLESIKAEIDKLKHQKESIEASIKQSMGEAESAKTGNYSVTWKTVNRTKFDVETARILLGEEKYNECIKISSSRVFRIAKSKNKENDNG